MRALIVDDHKINRSLLSNLIRDNFPKIKYIDEAESVNASMKFLEQTNYDVIFLDIELKDGVGFDVLKELANFVYVIVISSHKEYAIEAIKHNVVDYLVKPINILEFKKSVKKVIDLYERTEISKRTKENERSLVHIPVQEEGLLVKYKNGYVAIPKRNIVFVKADGKCSEIHVNDGKRYTSYKNLKEFENVLPTEFIRIHHSYLVNSRFIVYYSREMAHVKLSIGKELPVSTRKREELFKKFSVF